MTTVYEDLDLPDGGAPWPASVTVRLAGAQGRPVLGRAITTQRAILGETILRTGAGINNAGVWELDLWPNSDIVPAGTTWYVERRVGCQVFSSYLTVPVTGGPFEATTLEDDPLGTITPSALGHHAGDPTLHGGGIQLDVAYIAAGVTVTGTGGGLTATAIPGLIVTVPDLARPVHLLAHVPVLQTSGGPADASWGLFRSGSMGAFAGLDAVAPAGLNTTNARPAELFAELPAHSPGDYVVGATGIGGNLTTRSGASAIGKGSLRAMAA
jgi:hypothetical protein